MIESVLNKDIESIIEYSFKNKKNLRNSLIHPSSYKDKKNKPINHLYEFERLEFLGDKILGLSVASLIFSKFYHSIFSKIPIFQVKFFLKFLTNFLIFNQFIHINKN